jgi:hypothetical protein
MSGKPSWIVEDAGANNNGDLTYGFDGGGMWFDGDANWSSPAFPYRTSFTIPADQRVVVQVDIVHDYSCSDQAVAIFPEGLNPSFWWGQTEQDALFTAMNCQVPELWGSIHSTGWYPPSILTQLETYHLTITYDPNAVTNSFTVVTKSSSGTVLDSKSISDKLSSGANYRIGFSADSDGAEASDSGPPAYFKNLSITYGN